MSKRAMDLLVAVAGLLMAGPVLVVVMLLVWMCDWHSPLYIAIRVGRGGAPFRMIKLRSMVVNADRSGVSSTSGSDRRITPVGHFIRKYKLDEVTQLWNVLRGDMSLVGPRPQVPAGVDVYTRRERELLSVRPGITDFASIVFADEGAILHDSPNPDADYDRLIRPWKSRLGLVYIERRSLWVDVQLVVATTLGIVSRKRALAMAGRILLGLNVPAELVRVASRAEPLLPAPPPGDEFSLVPDGAVPKRSALS